MASVWFTLSIFFCVISQIITFPLGKTQEERGHIGLNEQAQREQTGRVRRAGSSIPPGCEKGVKFVIINVTHCPVLNSEYNADKKQCLEKILHVPGMPDGDKGYIYIAYNHYLYKTYQATTRRRLVKCPVAVVAPTTDLATSPPSKTVNPTTANQKAGTQSTSGNLSTKVVNVVSKPTTKANVILST